jgi:hypothetical protein
MTQVNGKILLTAILVLFGCSSPDEPAKPAENALDPDTSDVTDVAAPNARFAAVARDFQEQAETAGQAMMVACQSLGTASLTFLDNPTPELQSDAQVAWHQCYEHWQRFSLFHQAAFNPTAQDELERSRRLINIRPFLPGYIDALPDYPYTGLVHETGMDLTLVNLLEQHQLMDLESPALGFPVVETLLWQSDPDTFWLTSGADSDLAITRRHQYLTLATDHLLQQLQLAYSRWSGQAGFTGLVERAQQRIVLTSLERQIRQGLLDLAFTADATDEPDWHHPSLVAGQGRRHLLARLQGLEALLRRTNEAPGALESWIDRSQLTMSGTALRDHLTDALDALSALPENAPAGDPDPETWERAVAAVTLLADDISSLRNQSLPAQNAQ